MPPVRSMPWPLKLDEMKTLYLDIFSGISGDMFIGAILDLGVNAHDFENELKKLKLDGYHLHIARKQKSGIEGVKFDVHLPHESDHGDVHAEGAKHDHSHPHSHSHSHSHSHFHSHGHGSVFDLKFVSHEETEAHDHQHGRNFSQIKKLIHDSALSEWVKEKAIAVFHRIAVAEGKIHGHPPDEVHFHEVGAVDSIVDIVGACICLEMIGKPRVLARSVVEGTGFINCAHGRFPIPAPATLEIFSARNIAVAQCEEPHELVTPTGAALLAEFVTQFTSIQGLLPEKIGYGLGTRDNKTRPNVLRAVIGQSAGTADALDWDHDTVAVLETNLDDINAEILGSFVERALASGALDVFHTSIQMKKNRPGVLLTILCDSSEADKFSEMILRETTAFGVRRTTAERRKLKREFVKVKTSYGEVTIKLGKLNGKVVQTSPEFESCRQLAADTNIPLKKIYEAALHALRTDTK